MKTEELNIIEAIRALDEGKCKGISSNDSYYDKSDFGSLITLRIYEILGTWKIIDPVITPEPGEVWETDSYSFWIYEDKFQQDKPIRLINQNGSVIDKISDMTHNQNGWRRVFPPVEEQS